MVVNSGVPLPLPSTREAANLVAGRAAAIQRRYGVPFLLENPAHYLPDLPADPEIGEEFVNRLGPDGIARELEWARTIWRRYHPSRKVAA